MTKTIGDRIKEKRKELGLTQLELAEKLNITDRAVSKWEQNEGNPDISLLPLLAELFDVSLDYLMTGKNAEEKIITMSKIELCAKKDDPSLLGSFDLSSSDEDKKGLWHYIIKYDSANVFNTLMQKKEASKIFNLSRGGYEFNGQVNEILYFLIVTNNLNEVTFFGFSDIGFADSKELSDKALKALMGDKRVNDSTRELVLTSHKRELIKSHNLNFRSFNNRLHGNVQILYPFLLSKAIDFKEWSFAKLVLEAIADANAYIGDLTEKKVINRNDPSLRKSDIDPKTILLFKATDEINPYSNRDNFGNHINYYYAIKINAELLEKLLKSNQYDLLDSANEICRRLKMDTIPQKNIELAKMKSDENVKESDIIKFDSTENGLVKIDALFRLYYDAREIQDRLVALTKIKKDYIPIFEKVLKENYVHYLELVYDLASKKDFKSIYKFAHENHLISIEKALMSGDVSAILDTAKICFIPDYNEVKKMGEIIRQKKSVYGVSNLTYLAEEAKNLRYKIMDKLASRSGASEDDKKHVMSMLDTQMSNIRLEEEIGGVEDILAYKKKRLEEFVKQVDDQIEEITNKKKSAAEYEKIKKDINFDYINDLVNNGNLETAVIKLCVRLESILKFKFKYEGDFFEMIDTLIKNHLKDRELINCWDDEDNLYYANQQADIETVAQNKKYANYRSLLHKLRIKRNNLVHAESNSVEFSKEDMQACIKIVEELDK